MGLLDHGGCSGRRERLQIGRFDARSLDDGVEIAEEAHHVECAGVPVSHEAREATDGCTGSRDVEAPALGVDSEAFLPARDRVCRGFDIHPSRGDVVADLQRNLRPKGSDAARVPQDAVLHPNTEDRNVHSPRHGDGKPEPTHVGHRSPQVRAKGEAIQQAGIVGRTQDRRRRCARLRFRRGLRL